MFILLIAPPAAGKSTLIRLAKQKGLRAIDLEDAGHGPDGSFHRLRAAERLAKENPDECVLVGMADVDPDVFPHESIKLMLLPSREVYRTRLALRDREQKQKEGQGGMKKYDEFVEWSRTFDHVIQNDDDPEKTLEEILTYAPLFRRAR